MKAAELEFLLTADSSNVEAGLKGVQTAGERLEKKPIVAKVDGDATDATEAMSKVEAAAKKIVSAKTVAVIDADIEKGTAQVGRIEQQIEELQSRALGGLDVDADIAKAEAKLQRAQRSLDGLTSARAKIEVDADTSRAERELDGLSDSAGEAGADAGESAGASMTDGIVGALDSTPVVGAVVGIAALAATGLIKAFQDGLQVEVRQDRLQALTGIDESQAARFGRDASEAYASGFGESIESNMDTTRLALQGGLLDVDSTRKDSQHIISSLAGISDVLGEEVAPVSQAVTTMLRTGLVKSADEAFDVLATGARNGVNASEDLIDTFVEYPALFKRLGLDGPTSLGLISQGLQGGARNADLAADALKEFQIRATDGSEASAEGFAAIGLNAQDMTAKIAAGGDGAKEGLDQVLDGLRNMEDPVARNAAAVGLFGTQAEDLGEALFAMDPSTAVDSLGQVTGAAQTMFDTLASNDASKMETAKRNIEVAAEGMKGALASAFSEPLGDLADFVSENRGPIMGFLLGLANGAIDLGVALVNGMANGTEAVGDFVSTAIPPLLDALAGALEGFDAMTPGSQGAKEFREWADGAIEGIEEFDTTTEATAQNMRDSFLPGLEEARTRLNEFGQPIVNDAYVHDMMLRNADAISNVGLAADGTVLSMDGLDTANLSASATGATLQAQLVTSAAALADELAAAEASGEGQTELSARYNTTRDALAQQLETMGLTTDQAYALVDAVLQTPEKAETAYASNSDDEKAKVQALADRITTLPDGTVVVSADTSAAQTGLDSFVTKNNGKTIKVYVDTTNGNSTYRIAGTGLSYQHDGSVLMPMAGGGTLTPMAPIAQHVSPNTWRVVGDRMDVRESYIPHDGSARSKAILLETMRLFGVLPMADGAVLSSGPTGAGGWNGSGSLVRELGDYLYALMTGTGRQADAAARAYTDELLGGEVAVIR